MRRLLRLLAVLALPACGPGVSGTYALVSVDGQELPVTVEFLNTIRAASLTLSDSTYELTLTAGDLDPESFSGTFTLGESNVIHFSYASPSSPSPPPPPPPDRDTVSAVAPQARARTVQPEFEDRSRFRGMWDGDQITIPFSDPDQTWVFRR